MKQADIAAACHVTGSAVAVDGGFSAYSCG